MMAKSICRGMTAAFLFACAMSAANAADKSLGSGNGPLGNRATVQSYNGAGHAVRSSNSYRHGSFIVMGIDLDGAPAAETETTVLAPKAKIIDVNTVAYNDAFAPRSGCVIEYGVCVIRGGQ